MQHMKYHEIIAIESIKRIADLLETLEHLSTVLAKSDLATLTSFNQAYVVITQGYMAALATGRFEDPKAVERLSLVFAGYYLGMLNQYAKDQPTPAVWRRAYELSGRRPRYRSLLLAANAHINHDLPLALRAAGLDNYNEADFYKADRLFRRSARNVIRSFSEPDRRLDLLKRGLAPLYAQPVMAIVLHYRHRAWRDGLDANVGEPKLIAKTLRIADFLD